MNNEEKNQYLKKDKKFILHAFDRYNSENSPFIAVEGKGPWITDIDGKKYLDGMSGMWCVNVGYGRNELSLAASNQLDILPFYPMTNSHIPAIKLGEKLNEWLDDEYVIFFSSTGSEANEAAFKIARQYHQQKGDMGKYKFISRYRAYHGNTMGALAATGQAQRKYSYEPLSPGFIHVSPPDMYRSLYKGSEEEIGKAYVAEIERVIKWELDRSIAGIIMEPIITGGGVIIPPKNYLKEVEKLCEKYNILLIIDEVLSGFGRTGEKFGFMNYNIKPDIITMAKGLTSGYLPLSATAVKKSIVDAIKGKGEYEFFRHVTTFGGHPASCMVALENLKIVEEENLVNRSRELGERLVAEMSKLQDHPNVGDIRGKGLLVGIEMVKDKISKEPLNPEKMDEIIKNSKVKGLLLGRNGDTVEGLNNVLMIGPPLSIADKEFDFLVKTLKEVINTI